MSVTVCINDGDTHNSPCEQLEAKYPILVERYALRPDSGGPGRQRGGLGADIVIEALAPLTVSTTIERAHCRPWGLHGGREAAGNALSLRLNGTWNHDMPNAKVMTQRISVGDAFMMRSGGGGGFGNPLQRDVACVADDLVEGYVSAQAAASDYGVVADPITGEIDATRTVELRGIAGSATNIVDPIV